MEISGVKAATPSVKDVFAKMDYGPAPEADNVVQAWLDDHDRAFGHFINNQWVKPEDRKTTSATSPFDGKTLATTLRGTNEDVDTAVKAARAAHAGWSSLSGADRAKHLYSIARHVQKHHRLVSVLESMDNGKTVRETRDADVQVVIRHLYHYAGWASLMDEKMSDWSSIGVIGAIVPWNFPLMLLTWKIAPALAMGNTVVLKPASATQMSALLFAEICAEAGLPPGVFNVVTGNGAMGQVLAEHPDVDKVGFTGSTEVGKILRQAIAGTGKKISLELGGKSPVIVYESADLDSAVESVVDAIWFNQGQVCSAGSKLLVQQTVFNKFIEKIKTRLGHFRIGPSLDKCVDMGPLVNKSQLDTVSEYVESARADGAEIFQAECPKGSDLYYPPTLITNVNTASRVVMEEIFGPVLVAMPFRTEKEAIAIANNTMYGLGASVHSEKLPLALETAKAIKAGTVWINCHNLFDAAAGFGGYKQSGFGRDGGQEGLYEYVKPKWMPKVCDLKVTVDLKKFGAAYNGDRPALPNGSSKAELKVDHTYKLYYGGAQKRPDAMYSAVVRNAEGSPVAQVGQANRKDVRNAVEVAKKAQPGWEKRSGFNRSQILYYIAENLELRANEFAAKLEDMGTKNGAEEVRKSVERLFYWAALADKFGGTVQETQLYGTVIKIHEAVGVIGIGCPDSNPLLGFISLLAPAIARGNSVIVVPSERNPLAALDLYQVFDTSDLPGGVVNILSGEKDHVIKYLTEHQDVDAVWYFGSQQGSKFVEHASSVNVKRTWVNYGLENRDWFNDAQGQGDEFLYHCVQAKNVWLAMGEIFAN